MQKIEILEILKQIKYPGYSRDIVSFGMVRNIVMHQNRIQIDLLIGTQKGDVKAEIGKQVESVLLDQTSFEEVEVNITEPVDPNQAGQKKEKVQFDAQELPGVKHVIAVASGKGGVGKSTVAVNLAAALSREYKVGLLDLDIYGPSLPTLTGVDTAPVLNADQKLVPIEKYGLKLMSFGFISGNRAPAIWRGPMVSKLTQQFFEDVYWGELDYLILDLPPGTGDIQLTLVQKLKLSGAVIITTPQSLATIDAQKGADMFRKVNTRVLGIVENMTHFLCPHCNTATEIFPGNGGQRESLRLNVPLLGQVYLTPEIALSADEGLPYVIQNPDSPVTAIYTEIAGKINTILNSETQEP